MTVTPPTTAARRELSAWLTRSTKAGHLTLADAARLRADWQGGAQDLPLPAEDAIGRCNDEAVRVATLSLASLLRRPGKADLDEFREIAAAATLRALWGWQEAAETDYRRKSRRLAWALLAGTLGLLAWHRGMRANVQEHLLRQTLLGGRGEVPDRERTDRLVQRETLYLQRFADDLAVRREQARPLSREYVAERAAGYAGTARGEFFRTLEHGPDGQAAGWVAEYLSHDEDGRVCGPCHEAGAVRWYLSGRGPWPGQVCLGRARCRCRRVLRYRPDIYHRLLAEA